MKSEFLGWFEKHLDRPFPNVPFFDVLLDQEIEMIENTTINGVPMTELYPQIELNPRLFQRWISTSRVFLSTARSHVQLSVRGVPLPFEDRQQLLSLLDELRSSDVDE